MSGPVEDIRLWPCLYEQHSLISLAQLTVALLSILAARAIAVPLSPAFPIPELEYVLNHSEASLLVSSPKFASKAQQVLAAELTSKPAHVELPKHTESADATREEVPLEDSAEPGQAGLMLYTSGTTNKPVRNMPSLLPLPLLLYSPHKSLLNLNLYLKTLF